MEKMEESAKNVEEEVERVVKQAREFQESGASLISKISVEEQSIRHKANSLESSIRRLRSLIHSLLSQKLLDPNLADKANSPTLACMFTFSFFFFFVYLIFSFIV